ncbi:hypothetical protein SteCoe_23715 [Stentor coeruleus]|uniref:PPM-type phosphatase domain-containing protein n=1 Tax=Stentor coeruleus TaxID=5963 RepID=A0A1R2BJ82_9CILI|nr:hypothetical protein SteCoe_23715 [Stentor coeruleus]
MGTCTFIGNKTTKSVFESLSLNRPKDKTPITPGLNICFEPKMLKLKKNTKNPREDFQVEGFFSSPSEDPFAEKPLTFKGNSKSNENFIQSNISISCRRGLKESYNQDNFFLVSKPHLLIAGVFDGYGLYGHIIASLGRKLLPEYLISDLEISNNPIFSLEYSFRKTQKEIVLKCSETGNDCLNSGCSAAVIIIINSSLYTAHIGNCRVYLSKLFKTNLVTILLTKDHDYQDPNENSRIRKFLSVSMPLAKSHLKPKIFHNKNHSKLEDIEKNTSNCLWSLTVTRAFGDLKNVEFGVISEPFISENKLLGNEIAVILCTEGTWKYVETTDISRIIKNYEIENSGNVLANLAWSKWIEQCLDLVEDITNVVIPL